MTIVNVNTNFALKTNQENFNCCRNQLVFISRQKRSKRQWFDKGENLDLGKS